MPIQRGVMCTGENYPALSSEVQETVTISQPNVTFIMADHNCGSGTLYLTTKRLIWLGENNKNGTNSFAIDYYTINLHAISRDLATHALPCIYCQLAGEAILFEEEKQAENSNEEEDDVDEKAFELLLVPQDENVLDSLFKTMSEMSALNPNPEDEKDDEEDDDDEDDEEEEEEEVSEIDNGDGINTNAQKNTRIAYNCETNNDENTTEGWVPDNREEGAMEDAIEDF